MEPIDNLAVTKNTDEVQTSDSTSPVEEQQTPVVEDATEGVAPTTDADVTTDYQEPQLPEEESEKGKAFAKYRNENRQLKQELEALKKGLDERKTRQSSFDQLKKPQSDIDQTVEYKLDEIRAREKYPQLDPSNEKFDPDFEEEVASVYFFNIYQGRNVKISDIAKRLTDKRGVPQQQLKKVEAEVTQKVKNGITQKEQASLTASSRSQPGYSSAQEHESLVQRSRTGDNWAIAERVKRATS